GEVGDPQEGLLLLGLGGLEELLLPGDQAVELRVAGLDLGLASLDLGVVLGEVLLLGGEGVELAVEVVLALLEAALGLLELVPLGLDRLLELLALGLQLGPGVDVRLLLDGLGVDPGAGEQL